MTSIFEVQALETRPFPIKTSVISRWDVFVVHKKPYQFSRLNNLALEKCCRDRSVGAVLRVWKESRFKICRNTVDECIVRSNEVFPSSLKEKTTVCWKSI